MNPSIVKRCLVGAVLAIAATLPGFQSLHTSVEGLKLIADYEGCRLQPYQCSAGVWTDGIGNTSGVIPGKTITERQAAEKRTRQYFANSAASRIKEVADTIQGGDFEPSEAWAADTWAAIEALTKVMRKAGYPKPRKAPQKAADAPMPGQAGLPLGDAPEAPESAS